MEDRTVQTNRMLQHCKLKMFDICTFIVRDRYSSRILRRAIQLRR